MMNIYLIGYRCVGKTTVGQCLAERLGWRFADSDKKIVEDHGMTISDMVSKHGWDYFREKESRAIRSFKSENQQVVSTGGGMVLNPENIQVMKHSGLVVWLKASPETIRARMSADRQTSDQRPALSGKGIFDEIADVLKHRNPLYETAADISVETDDRDVVHICEEIVPYIFNKQIETQI